MALSWSDKDPDEHLDYLIDWSGDLGSDADTITASTWIVPTGITKTTDSFAATATKIWLSGGSVGNTYTLTNRVTTALGRIMERSVQLSIR